MARFPITSLVFMLVEVPEPVWKTSTTNWSSSLPSMTSRAAVSMAPAGFPSRRPSSRFACAAASLTSPMARMNGRGRRRPLMGKFRTARRVCAP